MTTHAKATADLRLACIQFQPAIGRLDDNLKSMERLIRQAAGRGASVV
ncbi:MAG: hydratase, partial [Mesorhizobium sp.]